ncbi:3-oxo-5-alpha-steroid 4-dehydrogenase 1 [Python bivittatus]|uniref:3-oxo-5alpha-steroid 4-dehydrogenase (NADP(+)) n=1 Tax=Python bivittatus TaxID=176946 RepID=A0A9F2R399_PYTBI|nr:3-oxo-5-alpha-steroid 4-dehydrogenase 1 [Python bivittatus]
MESAAVLASNLLCSRAFWQRVSGPQEERLLKLMSYGIVVFLIVAVALVLHRAAAPYGRYYSASRGRPVPATLAWMVQEAPSFLFPLLLVLCSGGARLSFWPNRILLGLFLVHYFYRSFIFPFLIRGGKPTPFPTFVLAFVFCLYNGYLQGRSLSNYAEFSSNWLTEPHFILGIAGWLGGLLINVHSDHILRNLRKPGETGYKIPRGGMFEYITGANYFGEIVEWCGFALACRTLESKAFAINTLLVLGSRAYTHHQWYLNKFEDYPRSRKIVIPFVF